MNLNVKLRDLLDDITIQQIGLGLALGLLLVTWYQACLTRDTLHKSLEAFVYNKEVKIAGGGPDESGQFVVVYGLANSGSTQARRVQVKTGMEGTRPAASPMSDLPNDFKYIQTGPTAYFNLIGAKEEASGLMDIDNALVHQIKDGKAELFVYGTIRYCDIFKAPHVTRFCQRFNDYRIKAKTGESFYDFGFCGSRRHNCDDEDCLEGQDTPVSYCR
jgi:hypothetical protein